MAIAWLHAYSRQNSERTLVAWLPRTGVAAPVLLQRRFRDGKFAKLAQFRFPFDRAGLVPGVLFCKQLSFSTGRSLAAYRYSCPPTVCVVCDREPRKRNGIACPAGTVDGRGLVRNVSSEDEEPEETLVNSSGARKLEFVPDVQPRPRIFE